MWFWGRKEKNKITTEIKKEQPENTSELETASEIELEQAVSSSDVEETSVLDSEVTTNEVINQELVDLIDGLQSDVKFDSEEMNENGYEKYRQKLKKIVKS